MTVYTDTFGGDLLYPSQVAFKALSLASTTTTLSWPLERDPSNQVLAGILEVTAGGSGRTITLPDAMLGSNGAAILFNNIGADTFTVLNSVGATVMTVEPGAQWMLYLRDNSTAAGGWRSYRFGASTAQAQAAALAGAGLEAISSTLNQALTVDSLNSDYTIGDPDRAIIKNWDGAAGTITLPLAVNAGAAFLFYVRNSGTGSLSVACSGGDTINGFSSKTFQPGDSALVFTDGDAWYTIGYGVDAEYAFDFAVINLNGLSGTYTLSGAELNRIAYRFTGALAGNIEIVVPSTVQQYWVDNQTTGYTLGCRTSTQSPALNIASGSRGIYYCDGTDFVAADTASLATPISISQGGTGATTASGARTNLGATSVGNAVFIAASAAAARGAIGAPSADDSVSFAVAF